MYNEYEIGETEGYRKGYEAGRDKTELKGKFLWFGNLFVFCSGKCRSNMIKNMSEQKQFW